MSAGATSATVLGTRLAQARDDDRPRTVLLSDLHVTLDGGATLARLQRLLRDAAARAPQTRVLLLGDLFDYLIGPRQLALRAHRDVVEALRAAADAGVALTALHGNRDFMLDAAFERLTGVRVVPGGLLFRLGDRTAVALHGDELCLHDLPYQRSKPVLRHAVSRAVARHLPLSAALWLGEKIRARSMQSTAGGDQGRFDPVADALRAVFGLGVDLLVFGHIHRPARGRFEDRGEYCILPAFEDQGVHLLFEGGELRFRGGDGAPLPDYPSRTFPALRRA